MTLLPDLEASLFGAAEHRYGRRRAWPARGAALAAAVAVAAIAVLAVRIAASDPGRDEQSVAPAVWSTSTDTGRGFEVTLPAGWQLAGASFTPNLSDPRELFVASTGPLAYRPGRCNMLPVAAVEELRPQDALVTLQERGRGPASLWVGFVDRPPSLAKALTPGPAAWQRCVTNADRLTFEQASFTEGRRHLIALVAFGADVSAGTRDHAYEILDRLRFDPARQPEWEASP